MDSTLRCLAEWMPRQRWYAGKGRTSALRVIGFWDLETEGEARARTYLVVDESSLPAVVYQVPVVARPTVTVDPHSDHVVGSPEPGTTLVDGPHDAAYTDALFRLVTHGGRARGANVTASGSPVDPAPAETAAPEARVLSGEQSNTSVIYERVGGRPVICKVFRQVHAGKNPDIELQTALALAGSSHVPGAVGYVEGEWVLPGGTARGALAFAQEFFADVEDAWRVALRAAGQGDDFSDRARALGRTTAEVHAGLARLFPTVTSRLPDRTATADSWLRRLTTAVTEVPAIAAHRDAVEGVYHRAMDLAWPALQRVHGDLHLGQALLVPERGWVLVDFEGEPLRPMAERVRPDLALRDVSGMLRSFDYVAGSLRLDERHGAGGTETSVRTWARSARSAFLSGYAQASGIDLDALQPLLHALELDKAVYEAIYETRNRPTWIAIPLTAIVRLTAG